MSPNGGKAYDVLNSTPSRKNTMHRTVILIGAFCLFLLGCNRPKSPEPHLIKPNETDIPQGILVGPLTESPVRGCGCYFSEKESNTNIFAGEMNGNSGLGSAYMMIDKILVELASKEDHEYRDDKGDDYREMSFSGSDVNVDLTLLTIMRGYEGERQEGTLIVTKSSRTKEIAISGGCGC